jgi:hypothetical protein
MNYIRLKLFLYHKFNRVFQKKVEVISKLRHKMGDLEDKGIICTIQILTLIMGKVEYETERGGTRNSTNCSWMLNDINLVSKNSLPKK